MKKPIIGISINYSDGKSMVAEQYYRCVEEAGGVPVMLPLTEDWSVLEESVRLLDGLLLTGGGDMSPEFYRQTAIDGASEPCLKRDKYDMELLRLGVLYQLPILGICRGMQSINIFFGGDLYQDIHTCYKKNALLHSQKEERSETTHSVEIVEDSLLYSIMKNNAIEVNSIHHQAVWHIPKGLRGVAFAPDGVCEAVEVESYPILGVQWHPEHLSMKSSENIAYSLHFALFKWLVEEANIHKRALGIHKKSFIVDSHCDTPMFFHYPQVNIIENEPMMVDPTEFDVEGEEPKIYDIKVSTKKMEQGRVAAVFMVAYIPQKTPKEKATAMAENLLNRVKRQAEENNNRVEVVTDISGLHLVKEEGKPAIFLGIENGWALGEDLGNIDKFYEMGVRYITLCHNGDNQICDSANGSIRSHRGLSEFGRSVVHRMNDIGMLIDLSHAGEETFGEVLKESSKPVVATHSSCRALCDHPRNLSDEQIKSLADKGGVMQICLYQHFLTKEKREASIEDAIRHIKHVVELVGVDFVGVGSDFDGGGQIAGCQAENEMINITKALIKEGFSDEDIAKIMGGNFLRVLSRQK